MFDIIDERREKGAVFSQGKCVSMEDAKDGQSELALHSGLRVAKAVGREVMGADGIYELRERDFSHNANFGDENSGLRPENIYFAGISV